MQEVMPTVEYVPEGHKVQEEESKDPYTAEYVPDRQATQVELK
jgi:hypothetical protein